MLPIDQSRRPLANLALGCAALARGHNLVWFPEGGRTPEGTLQPFQAGIGLIVTAHPLPLIPIWIEGSFQVLPTGAWWPRRRRIKIVFGSALTPSRIAGDTHGTDRFRYIATALHDHVAELGSGAVQAQDVIAGV